MQNTDDPLQHTAEQLEEKEGERETEKEREIRRERERQRQRERNRERDRKRLSCPGLGSRTSSPWCWLKPVAPWGTL